MRRLCFVGDSHLAAIKLAIEAARESGELADVAIDTFGSNRRTIATCKVQDGCVVPVSDFVRDRFRWTSGGQEHIELARYDDIFVVAGTSPMALARYLPDGVPPPPSPALYRAVAGAAMEDWGLRLARRIASGAPAARVHFLGAPEVSELSPFARRLLRFVNGKARGREQRAARLRDIRHEIAAAVATLPHGLASIAGFPAGALDEFGAFTRHEFCRDSVRLRTGFEERHPAHDFEHMNAAYGREVLRHLGLIAPAGTTLEAA